MILHCKSKPYNSDFEQSALQCDDRDAFDSEFINRRQPSLSMTSIEVKCVSDCSHSFFPPALAKSDAFYRFVFQCYWFSWVHENAVRLSMVAAGKRYNGLSWHAPRRVLAKFDRPFHPWLEHYTRFM